MASQPDQVILTSLVHPDREPEVMLTADKTDPPVITWESPATLLVCYTDANIYGFDNKFNSYRSDDGSLYKAELVLLKSSTAEPCTTRKGAKHRE